VNGSELTVGHDSRRIMSHGTLVRRELDGSNMSLLSFSLNYRQHCNSVIH
jgi:hypothetical protein